MHIVLSSDDYYDANPLPIKELQQLNLRYWQFKISLFCVIGKTENFHSYPWIQYIFHGLQHKFCECKNWSKKDTLEYINTANKYVKDHPGVNFARVFKAPNWYVSKECVETLLDNDWIVAVHNRENYTHKNIYTGVINPKEIITTDEVQYVTTHVQNTCGNGIRESHRYLMALPECTKFSFITEMYN